MLPEHHIPQLATQRYALELSECDTTEALLQWTARSVPTLVASARASVALLERDAPDHFSVFALSGNEAIPMGASFPLDGTAVGACVAGRQAFYTPNIPGSEYQDNRMLAKAGLGSCLNVPLVTGGKVIGTLNSAREDIDGYSAEDIEMLSQIGLLLAVNLESRWLVERLSRAAEDTRLMLDVVSQGYLMLDLEARVRSEPSRILERWFGTFTGEGPLWEALRTYDRNFAERLERAWGHEVEGLPSHLIAHGQVYHFEWHALEARARVVATVREVTGEQRQHHTERVSREKTSFLAHMSHELRTPLTSIIGYTEMLREELEEPSPLAEDLGAIERSSHHLLHLVDNLLDISVIEGGTMTLRLDELELLGMLEQLIEEVRRSLTQGETVLEVELPAHEIRMRGDETKIRQVVLNLLSNAAKFTLEGTIYLRCVSEPEQVVLVVEDTGAGIDPSARARIFDAFEQADTGSTRFHDGAGLGLSICKKLVALMGGTLSWKSELGVGSRFEVVLPRLAPESSQALPGDRMHHVLVIDADPRVHALLSHQLEGFQVTCASSEEDALGLTALIAPDVVILEPVLPEANGWQVLSRLREERAMGAVPVIARTILGEEVVADAGMRVTYLAKASGGGALRALLGGLLSA